MPHTALIPPKSKQPVQTSLLQNDHSTEEVEVRGHLIDSLLLPKILDTISQQGGDFVVQEFQLGHRHNEESYARLQIQADSASCLEKIVDQISGFGATSVDIHDCQLKTATVDGAYPDHFYCATNQPTYVRISGKWKTVLRQEMDCGIAVDPVRESAKCIPMNKVHRGDLIVTGHRGIRVLPIQHGPERHLFDSMQPVIPSDKPKQASVREVVMEMRRYRAQQKKILVVAGPAVVHTGSVDHFCKLMRTGYVDRLFAGNALATQDIAAAIYGNLPESEHHDEFPSHHQRQNRLRAINTVRQLGGIRQAVEKGMLSKGIMYECVKRGIEFLLAGTIRDQSPLPEVITDTLVAQDRMRERLQDIRFCLMIASSQHAVAVSNLLPASVRLVCVDINPASVMRLSDPSKFHSVGLVTDIEPFLRDVVTQLTS